MGGRYKERLDRLYRVSGQAAPRRPATRPEFAALFMAYKERGGEKPSDLSGHEERIWKYLDEVGYPVWKDMCEREVLDLEEEQRGLTDLGGG